MKAYVMKFLISLLLMALGTLKIMAENRLHKEYKSDGNHHEHGTKDSNYKHDSQDGIERRVAFVPQVVFNNPNQPCYTQFFAGGAPPQGLRFGQINLQNIRYICQMVNGRSYYGTMFDEGRGIAVFSAYKLTQANATFQSPRRRPRSWKETPGIQIQGSNAIYRRQPFDKGHLVPAATYKDSSDSLRSTFVYTNAVPQRPAFNRGQWAQFEERIRVYAQQCTQRPQPGDLYLITGTAFGHIQNNPRGMNQAAVEELGPAGNKPAIAIPNSLWTAGCCVQPNGRESFAVIGNNLQDQNQMLTQQITVDQLQRILTADVNNPLHNIGGPNVYLFPGNGGCSNKNNNLPDLPQSRRG
ncbi:nuclease-like isoform X1 [Acropora muricata]|uniref:nuclease-like isoform X1 n=1 Tax=Acropora muricata TaxID=159855 RepID=UPI0034E38347